MGDLQQKTVNMKMTLHEKRLLNVYKNPPARSGANKAFIQILGLLRRQDIQFGFESLLATLVGTGKLATVTQRIIGLHQMAVGAFPTIILG